MGIILNIALCAGLFFASLHAVHKLKVMVKDGLLDRLFEKAKKNYEIGVPILKQESEDPTWKSAGKFILTFTIIFYLFVFLTFVEMSILSPFYWVALPVILATTKLVLTIYLGSKNQAVEHSSERSLSEQFPEFDPELLRIKIQEFPSRNQSAKEAESVEDFCARVKLTKRQTKSVINTGKSVIGIQNMPDDEILALPYIGDVTALKIRYALTVE